MATTTNYGIYYPVQTDSVAPLHTAFGTLASSVESALTTNLKPLSDNNKNYNYTVTSTAEMTAITSPPSGSTCFISAGDKGRYYYNGTSWVLQYQPWKDYGTNTTLLTTNGTVAITGAYTINTSKYMVSGNRAFVEIQVTFSATPTFAGLHVLFPATSLNPVNQYMPIGDGLITTSTPKYFPTSVRHTATTYGKVMYQSGLELKAVTNTANPVTIVSGTVLNFNFSYPLL